MFMSFAASYREVIQKKKKKLPFIRHPATLPKSLSSFAKLSLGSRTKEKREATSAKIFTLHSRLAGMPLIKIGNITSHKMVP